MNQLAGSFLERAFTPKQIEDAQEAEAVLGVLPCAFLGGDGVEPLVALAAVVIEVLP